MNFFYRKPASPVLSKGGASRPAGGWPRLSKGGASLSPTRCYVTTTSCSTRADSPSQVAPNLHCPNQDGHPSRRDHPNRRGRPSRRRDRPSRCGRPKRLGRRGRLGRLGRRGRPNRRRLRPRPA